MIDSHCHIDLFPEPADILAEIRSFQIKTIAVSINPASFRRLRLMCAESKDIVVAAGLHPSESAGQIGQLESVWSAIEESIVIGEVGLDRYFLRDKTAYLLQLTVFESILQRCVGKDRILNVHSRSAERDVLRLLGEYDIRRVILHWYSGPTKWLSEIVDRGYYLSIGPAVVYSKKVRELAKRVPRHLLLTESDGPNHYHGGVIGRPRLIEKVQEEVASLWGTTPDTVEAQVAENFKQLFDRVTL